MVDTPKARLHNLLARFASGHMSAEEFSSSFETVYNLELKKVDLDASEAAAFAAVFEKVIWYSPFPDERKQVPNYVGDDEVKEVAQAALRTLRAARVKGAGG